MTALPKTEKHPGKMALHLALKSQSKEQNPRKVVLGSEAHMEQAWEVIEAASAAGDTPEELIASTASLSLDKWLAGRRKEIAEFYDDEFTEAKLIGAPPAAPVGKIDFVVDEDWEDEAFLALIPAEQSWHIPAHLYFGGWNECPVPEVQCALWKHWQETYDAHIVAVCGEVIQARVHNPPKDREAALKLAWEQYLYCTEIVDQDAGSLSVLADQLLGANVWCFWWD